MADGIDLKPFFALMNNEKVLKVFHAARQDVEIMVHSAGTVPHPIFDTQIAAMVCGFGDQVSYELIVRKLAKAQIDKFLALHRLVAPAPEREATHLCAVGCHASAHGLRKAEAGAGSQWPRAVAGPGNGNPDGD